METRKTRIMQTLHAARKCLADGRGVETARALLAYARADMAAAPAGTRRRWKHANKINARKRIARKAHAFADAWGLKRIGPYTNL